jgi:hypothetical protein
MNLGTIRKRPEMEEKAEVSGKSIRLGTLKFQTPARITLLAVQIGLLSASVPATSMSGAPGNTAKNGFGIAPSIKNSDWFREFVFRGLQSSVNQGFLSIPVTLVLGINCSNSFATRGQNLASIAPIVFPSPFSCGESQKHLADHCSSANTIRTLPLFDVFNSGYSCSSWLEPAEAPPAAIAMYWVPFTA